MVFIFEVFDLGDTTVPNLGQDSSLFSGIVFLNTEHSLLRFNHRKTPLSMTIA